MRRLYPYILVVLILSACRSELDQFNEQAKIFAENDKRIDPKEYETLSQIIKSTDDASFKKLKDARGEVNHTGLQAHLLKYFKARKVIIAEPDIFQPDSTAPVRSFNVNVFIENSASMDGYVKGVTAFETTIYNLLGDIKISGLCDSLNLNYINKSIPYQKLNALNPDIRDFIEKLEPSSFKLRGGDRSVSDLKNILNTVLQRVDEQNAAILISDFVFSPGNSNDAQNYLNNQSVGIKIDFAEKLKVFDLSAIIVQLTSNFEGVYYDRKNTPVQLNGKRPYYIWFIGSTQQISRLLEKKIADNMKGGYEHKLVLQAVKEEYKPSFKIQYKPRIGEFDSKYLADGIITDASPARDDKHKGTFGFNIAVNFAGRIQDAGYFLDTANYLLSDGQYRLMVMPIEDRNNASLAGFSHLLQLQTAQLKQEDLKIEVIGKTPSWVYNSTSIDDSGILHDPHEQTKTFGLKYLVEGVCDAFYPRSKLNAISTINIQIKK